MLATRASADERSAFNVWRPKAGAFAQVVVIRKDSGFNYEYTVSPEWLPKLQAMDRALDPVGRYHAVMKAEGLFTVKAGTN